MSEVICDNCFWSGNKEKLKNKKCPECGDEGLEFPE